MDDTYTRRNDGIQGGLGTPKGAWGCAMWLMPFLVLACFFWLSDAKCAAPPAQPEAPTTDQPRPPPPPEPHTPVSAARCPDGLVPFKGGCRFDGPVGPLGDPLHLLQPTP